MSLRRLNVFLSSTGKDLADHRKAIFTHLRAADAFHVEHSETFGARAGGAVDVCHERVRDCEVLVGLIGHYRGWEPDGDNGQRSITEMEYDWAVDYQLDRLMYVLPDGAVAAPDMTAEAAQRQQAFRARVLGSDLHDKRVHDGEFVSPDALAAAVITGLQNLLYGRMLKAIREAEDKGKPADPPPSASPAAPSPEAALAELAADTDLDALLAKPGSFDIAKLEAAVAARASARVEKGKFELKAAAADYARLGALSYGIDAAKAHRYYALAAETGAADGATLFWLAHTALAAGKIKQPLALLAAAVESLDDSDDARGALWAFIGLGDLRKAAGDLPKARSAYDTARAIAARAARLDCENAGWQRDLSVSYERIGDVLVAQGNLPEALKSFRESLDIAQRLAASDPDNAVWQHDLSASFNKVGDVLVAQGNLAQALKSFRESHAIFERLAAADLENAEWQRDLSVSYVKHGDVLVAQGNLPEALEAFHDSLDIRKRLAAADPENAGWTADLAAVHGKIGQALATAGETQEALDMLRKGRAIVAPLAGSGHQLWLGYLRSFDADIARLEKG